MMSKIKGHVRCYNVDTEYCTDIAIDAIATFINLIDNKDYFGLLLASASGDTAGAVTVTKVEK